MRGLIQRVSDASVSVDQQIIAEIGSGLLLLLAVEKGDEQAQADKLLNKVLNYRVFADAEDKMNLNLQQVEGELLIVSQFTLAADTDKGLRPSFSSAAHPGDGQALYEYFVTQAQARYPRIATGRFGADMKVRLLNDGPVTFLLTS